MSTPQPFPGPVGSPELIDASLRVLCGEVRREAPELAPALESLLLDDPDADGAPVGAGPGDQALFPTPDFDRHPYYSEFGNADAALGDKAADRYLESFSNLLRAEQALARRAARNAAPRPRGDARSPALAALEDDGIWRFSLTPSELSETLERSEPASLALEARRLSLAPEQRSVEGVLQLLAEHATPGEDFDYYSGLLDSHGVPELLEQYYGVPFRLLAVNLQINSGQDTGIARACSYPDGRRAPTYYMHIDSGVGLVKILMYRRGPVTADNGAFRYVPGSHRALDPVQRVMRKASDKSGLDSLKAPARAEFMALPPALRRKANYGNDLLPELGMDTGELLAREVVLEGEAGDGFLTDVNGAHRGNMHDDPEGRREMFKFVLKAMK